MRQRVKGKGLLIGIGPKAISKVLRPNNGNMGVRVKKINGKFDNAFKMGPKEFEGYRGNFMIQPINVSLNLNQEKHKMVHLTEKQNFDSVIGKENKLFNFGESSNATPILYPKGSNV